MKIIDSIAAVTNNTKIYSESKIIGASPLGREYTGIVYKDPVTNQIRKINISVNLIEEEIFCSQNSILKIYKDSKAYYRINGNYYNNEGSKDFSPDLIKAF